MEFSEYSTPFEGDFAREQQRLLGTSSLEHMLLLGAIHNYRGFYHAENLENIRRIFDLRVKTGARALSVRHQVSSPWFAQEISRSIEGEKVADIGCCDGFFTVFYAINHPNSQFVGIDISSESLKSATERARRFKVKNVSWIQGDALDSSCAQYFDADTIILQDVLHLLFLANDPQRQAKMLKLLAPHQNQGGLVIVAKEGRILPFQETDQYALEESKSTKVHYQESNKDVDANVIIFRHK